MKNDLKFKTGELVKVIAGSFRKKNIVSEIHHVNPKEKKVYLTRLTKIKIGKKGQNKEFMIPIHISNIQLVTKNVLNKSTEK